MILIVSKRYSLKILLFDSFSEFLVAVRKLLVWKTNKEKSNSLYPPFVVHWTDYSPGRGSPLDREVKLAPDEKTVMKIADAMVEENIKKGWEKVK